jgi:hypothetical protein
VRRSFAVLAGIIAIVFVGVSPAAADGGQFGNVHSNVVQLANSNSASPVVGSSTVLAYDAPGAAVTDTNIAYARSFDCTGCRTVAVAVQVVVVEGTPSNYQPQNGAVAVNDTCVSCQTFAYAHQYVIQTTHEVHWQKGYSQQLWSFQQQFSQVAHSGEDFATMSSQLDQLSLDYYNAVYQAVQSQAQDGGHEKSDLRQVQQPN